jgi:plasmid stability protein
MSQILIRGLDPKVKEALAKKARKRGVSLEAEARRALEQAALNRSWLDSWLASSEELRGEFILPERTYPRTVDL